MPNNQNPCPMPIVIKAKEGVNEFVRGEVKNFIIWKAIALISFLWGSYNAIPVIQETIAANRQPGFGMFECRTKAGKLINTYTVDNCASKKDAHFKPFNEPQGKQK